MSKDVLKQPDLAESSYTVVDGSFDRQTEYRKLPAVDALLRDPQVALFVAEYGQEIVTDTIRALLATARSQIAAHNPAPPPESWPSTIGHELERLALPSLRPIVNATGVIIHTNLGRAPLSQAAREAVTAITHHYSNLEYDLLAGRRGSRYDHSRELLRQLTGAEDALVVNNCASAVYLILNALCQGRDVLISRGELVEIGGGFRVPDILRQSGANLVEVGTTNRTHLRDFTDAITPQTSAIMRVHASNFRQIGFTTSPTLPELADAAHPPSSDMSVLLIDDLGSGTLLDTTRFGLAPEPMIQDSIAEGADVIAFSGDKLLGGPQAGIILGREKLIGELRRHPLARALRVDKMTLAALDATLRSYQRGRALQEIPIWRMISATPQAVKMRAEKWRQVLDAQGIMGHIQEAESAVGGGSLPGETLSTWLLALSVTEPDEIASRLRECKTPIVCRIQNDRLLFDPRTVLPEQEGVLLQMLGQELRKPC